MKQSHNNMFRLPDVVIVPYDTCHLSTSITNCLTPFFCRVWVPRSLVATFQCSGATTLSRLPACSTGISPTGSPQLSSRTSTILYLTSPPSFVLPSMPSYTSLLYAVRMPHSCPPLTLNRLVNTFLNGLIPSVAGHNRTDTATTYHIFLDGIHLVLSTPYAPQSVLTSSSKFRALQRAFLLVLTPFFCCLHGTNIVLRQFVNLEVGRPVLLSAFCWTKRCLDGLLTLRSHHLAGLSVRHQEVPDAHGLFAFTPWTS